MLDKLKSASLKLDEISLKLTDPDIVNNNERYRELMKEYKNLTPLVEKYHEYENAAESFAEAEILLAEETDDELREMAKEQFQSSKKQMEQLKEELKILLLPKDPDDDRSAIVEIRGGAGGEEAALFAYSLYRMYNMYAASIGWTSELISSNDTELGGFKEVCFMLKGEGVYSRMKYESGVHRVQRVPDTESSGRVHTSTVTVAVLPEVEDVAIEIDPGDLQIDTYRASGAGGQHVNKTESAIRITHKPTGMVVECQDERSQHKNRDKAMAVLRSRLYEKKKREQEDQIAADRRSQVGTGDRSERIRTYNFPQGRLTDHRIGLTIYKLDAVMNGDLADIFDALITFDQTERLKNSSEGQAF
ncbi:MAG: peptide chain release factor 1 [Oscillospiraceae bacterium]|nr:peptide chain release factor 1 [Oscillospiraceae bacterium]MBQ4539172.1 peptide chain release factor 1 [Oscillospiraceae bacterium]